LDGKSARAGASQVDAAACRFCAESLRHSFMDLGSQPLANAYRPVADTAAETFFPLHAFVCANCFLVQIKDPHSPSELFTDYSYFSSYSESWLAHAEAYADAMTRGLGLGGDHLVVEIGSNDGYLLQYFKARGVRVQGVEPAANVARVAAERHGIASRVAFFGRRTAQAMVAEGEAADLLIGNNVLAHVPDINDFVAGLRLLLKPGGVISMEFPHLLRLLAETQFDTIYHEHVSYLSLTVVERIFAAQGLRLFDVEAVTTHGGSLRIFACHDEAQRPQSRAVADLRKHERAAGLGRLETYLGFASAVQEVKHALLSFLVEARESGHGVAGYGAPAKGNTLLNYCGVGSDLLPYTVDRSPHKQGRLLPGSGIPVFATERIFETRPDYLLILPWNLKDEIMQQMQGIRDWGGRFVLPLPKLQVL
jgi:SAM-dependent methyltransferase